MKLSEIQLLYESKDILKLKEIGIKKLQELTHPDIFNNPSEKEIATQLFKNLTNLLNTKVQIGKYNVEKIYNGDISSLYGDNTHLIKIVNFSSNNYLINNEFINLTKIVESPGNNFKFDYLPNPIEQLLIKSRGKKPRQSNVFKFDSGFLTLENIANKFPKGINGHHLAWMIKRCLVAIGCAYEHEITHNAILPNHILINPSNHQCKLIGWTFSLKAGEKLKMVPTGAKSFYHQSILKGGDSSLETDLYMLGKTFLKVASILPAKIDNFLISFLLRGESSHPWQLHEDFDKILLKIYGQPKFVPLEIK